MATSYTNVGGSGARLSFLIVSADIGLNGSLDQFIDGNTASSSLYFSPNGADPTGKFIKFEFPEDVLIDEAKWHQSDTTSHGTWKWQGSNNDSDWTDIGSSFTLGGATTQTQTQLNGNSTRYKYYRLVGVSGAVSWNSYLHEVEFKIDVSDHGASYLDPQGMGDRSASITITDDCGNGTNSKLVDGLLGGSDFWFTGGDVTGKYLKFDFGAGVVISECIFQQQNTSSHGTWIWQGSNNDADWTDVGASFALGGSVKQTITSMNGNETEYRYYRTLGVSGNSSTSPYIYEFDFKVGVESSGDTYDESLTLAISVISVQSASTEMSAGLSLGITADQGSGNIAEMDATIALSLAAAILQSESIEGAPQTYNELVTIAAKMGMSRSAIGSLQEAITLATLEGVGLTSQAIMVNALILQIVSSMDESFSVFVIATGNKLQFVFKKRKDHFTQ